MQVKFLSSLSLTALKRLRDSPTVFHLIPCRCRIQRMLRLPMKNHYYQPLFHLHPPWLLYKVFILSTIRSALLPLNPKFYQCHFLHLMVIQIRHDHEKHCVIEAAASENTSINFNFMRIHSLLV